jgi:hypothetical protein
MPAYVGLPKAAQTEKPVMCYTVITSPASFLTPECILARMAT